MLVTIERIDFQVAGFRIQLDTLYYLLMSLQHGQCTLSQRHIAHRVQTCQVFHRDTQVLHELVGDSLLQLHIVGILHILWLLIRLTIEIDNAITYLQRLSGQSYTTFHIVLTTVGRTGDNLTILGTIAPKFSTTCSIDGIEVTDTILCRQRVWVRTVRVELVTD